MCELPIEVLQEIFSYVDAKTIVASRRVCRRWKLAVDGLRDVLWRRLCEKDHGEVSRTYSKATLSWQSLYKSLALWPRLQNAHLTSIIYTKAGYFKVLENGVIAIANDATVPSNNSIVYFDSKTMKEVGRERLDFNFRKYDENDNFIVVVDDDDTLCIIPKSTKNRHFVGKIPKQDVSRTEYDNEFTLFENEVYYRNIHEDICVFKYIEDGYRIVVLGRLREEMVAVSDNQQHILTLWGNVFSLVDGIQIERTLTKKTIERLKELGFDWTSPPIYRWLLKSNRYCIYRVGTSLTMQSLNRLGPAGDTLATSPLIYVAGNRVIIVQKTQLQFYYDPFKYYFQFSEIVPVRRFNLIDLRTYQIKIENVAATEPIADVSQIDVISMEDGLKVIIGREGRVTIIEYTRDIRESEAKPNNVWRQIPLDQIKNDFITQN